MKVLESLQGEQVTVYCTDREETEMSGELLEVSQIGAIVKYSSHGREFIDFAPMRNIGLISHKITD